MARSCPHLAHGGMISVRRDRRHLNSVDLEEWGYGAGLAFPPSRMNFQSPSG
jgi:hypothetical protein